MAPKVFSRVLQFLAAVAVFSSVWLINSTQARVIGSPLARQTASDANKENSVHRSDSFKFLSDPEWRAKLQFGNKVVSDGEKSLPEETEQLKNLTADEQPTKQSEDAISGSGTVNTNSPHQSGNPFLRSKRDTSGSCSFPTNLPEKVKELNEFLHDSQYVGVIPEQDDYIPIPHDQPTNCPAAVGDWWPRPEINLRSTCPSIKEELDNGPDAYPRYVENSLLATEIFVLIGWFGMRPKFI